jgi:hypothetical protein
LAKAAAKPKELLGRFADRRVVAPAS